MVPRFFAPEATLAAGSVTLSAEESDHLRRVLRLGPGDEVAVFDGEGHEFLAHVGEAKGGRVSVTIGRAVTTVPEMRACITLVQAVLKGDKMDEVVRDAVMLGAAEIQPVISVRTDVRGSIPAKRLDRWTRVAIASTKQCGRARVARILAPCTLADWLHTDAAALRLMMVEPAAGHHARPLRAVLGTDPPSSVSVLVGPEGGWGRDEIDQAVAAGAATVSLGPRTLRADAVALAVLAILQFSWE